MSKKEFTIPRSVAQYWFDFMWEKGAIQKALIEDGVIEKEGLNDTNMALH